MRYGITNIYRVYLNYGATHRAPCLLIHYGYRWFFWSTSIKWTPAHGDSFMMEAFYWGHQVVSRLGFLIETGKSFESSIQELDEELRKEDERETASASV